jgi:hypothetical protein
MPGEGFANPLTERLVSFVCSISIEVRAATLAHETFLADPEIRGGAILIEARLHFPGDVLHEAGHRALPAPKGAAAILRHERRATNGRREERRRVP